MRPRPATSSPRCCRYANESLGAEHPDTLTARAELARWTGQAGDAAAARDQFAALLPVRDRVSGAEHPDTLTVRAELASLDRAGGGCGRGPRPVRRAAAGPRPGLWRRASRHAHRSRRPRPLDRAGGRCGRGPRPVRRAAAGPRTSPRRRAPRHAHRPRRPRPLDRAGGGSGRGPRPVRRAAAGPRAGLRAPSTPTRSPPAPNSRPGPGGRGMRPRPATSTPRCCRYANGS